MVLVPDLSTIYATPCQLPFAWCRRWALSLHSLLREPLLVIYQGLRKRRFKLHVAAVQIMGIDQAHRLIDVATIVVCTKIATHVGVLYI